MATEHISPAIRTATPRVHEHGWITESTHPTSEGTIVYVMCASCGARRIDLRGTGDLAPAALSAVAGPRG